MSKYTTYFVIYSDTSRDGGGLRPQVMWTFESSITESAYWELRHRGATFADMAGVEWCDELTDDDVLALSVEKLGDDGRMYTTFGTDEAGGAAFIEAAEDLGRRLSRDGFGDKARALVEMFNS